MPKTSTSFKKGNKFGKGAPKKEWTIKGLIQEALERTDKQGKTDKQYVYEKLVDMAKAGDITAQKEMNNRLEGMAKQSVDYKGELTIKPILGGSTGTISGNYSDSQAIEAQQED